MLSLIVLFIVCGLCRADYECLCNYNVEKPVLNSPARASQTIGYLYEFDCKPVTNVVGIDTTKWKAIAFEQQVRYVEMDPSMRVQTCPGDPSIEDILTTQSAPITSSSTSSSTTLAAKITSLPHSSVQTKTKSLPASTASTPSMISSALSPLPTSTTTATPTSMPSTTTNLTPTNTQSTSVRATNAKTQSTTMLKTTDIMKASSSLPTYTTSQSTVPTTTRQSTTASRTSTSTTKQTTRQTTTSETTTRTTQRTLPTTTRTTTLPLSLGNTGLCSASVRQYAQQDHEILAQNGRSCYTVVPHRVSWTHAESVCNHRGGHLFHVSSPSENYFIYNLLTSRFNHTVWMGLHDRGHEEKFSWTSGSLVTYTNWIPNRKSNFYSHDVEDCAVFVPYLNRGQWDDIPCGSSSSIFEPLEETHRFICQFGITTTQPGHSLSGITTTQPGHSLSGNTNLCPSHLRYLSNRDHTTLAQYKTSCYEWINQRASWSHAESICSKSGGHLVQINDAQEETFIQQFMTSHDSKHAIWIGLHDRVHEERFAWTSGEPVVYTNWIPGRKSNFQSHTTEDCVAFIPYKQGQWDDIPCGSSSILFGETGETHPYMCEYKINSGASGTGVIIG